MVSVPDKITSPYLHVLFHGFSVIEKHVPPVFARRQWDEAENSVCLLVSDPIHNYTKESSCGWFLLGEDEFLPRVLELRTSLLQQWGLRGTVWHGLSSGGYAAIKHCMRGGQDDLAFVVSPHNDPLILPQWTREAEPFSDLPAMARPQATTEIIRDWAAPGSARYLHVVIPEKDSYFALKHLRPIMEHLDGHPSLRAVKLRDGRGHGFIANSDYTAQLRQAVDRWERHRADAGAAVGAARAASDD
ncbi:hypothetical protein OG520_41540 (plasmid) [Streptomyces sp. NBC_00984]|uniref:hypothetical protein n=1 Tax=Streptomyces sp. NBC_00984 TaxID=2903700 RepID=UPI00386B2DDD|nr:hypothetical protein OG520_41540 [Streptomyces sp. NBC_00984]